MPTHRRAAWLFVIASLVGAPAYGSATSAPAAASFAPRPGVNPVLGDASWVDTFGVAPPAAAPELARIRVHLAYVESQLRRAAPRGLTAAQRAARARLLDALARYRIAGEFPRSDRVAERRPRLMDDEGRLCAVGYLIAISGHRPLLEDLRASHEWDYLLDIAEPRLSAWAGEHGFTPLELASIQPTYPPDGWPRLADRPTRVELARSFAELSREVRACGREHRAAKGTLITLDFVWPANDPVVAARSSDGNRAVEACIAHVALRHWRARYARDRYEPGPELGVVVRFRL